MPSGTVKILYGNKTAFLFLKIKVFENTVLCFEINCPESISVFVFKLKTSQVESPQAFTLPQCYILSLS